MPNFPKGLENARQSRATALNAPNNNSSVFRCLVVLSGFFLMLQTACMFRGHKAEVKPQFPPSPIRVVMLPFNLPADQSDLRWLSLASQVMMAKASEGTPDIEVVPFWEAMPAAIQVTGSSRAVTAEGAIDVAGRLSAKWATLGELSPSKDGISLAVDFIPAGESIYPFRFTREGSLEAVEQSLPEAFEQFLRYLNAKPLSAKNPFKFDAGLMRETVEALDREYGWFVNANPGKSETVVEKLLRSDDRLARVLFNPNLYPNIRGRRTEILPKENAPAQPAAVAQTASTQRAAQTPESPAKTPAQAGPRSKVETGGAAASQSVAAPSPRAQPIPTATYVPPPPRIFSQKLDMSNKAGQSDRPGSPQASTLKTTKDIRELNQSTQVSVGGKTSAVARNKASLHTFGIQVGALRSKEEADSVAANLARAGMSAEIETADLKGKGIWYRVRLYGFKSRTTAVSAGEKLLSAGLIKGFFPIP